MGNNSNPSRLPPIEWEKVDTDNGIEIYRNKANNQLAEKRIIALNQEYDHEEELEIYKMRQQNNDALVRILGIQNLHEGIKPNLICSGQKKIFVYTEKMSHRLSECPQLTFPQSLLFLKEALKAFQRIYKDQGPVQVTKQMIGINYLGEVKSWLNENWALNHRDHQYSNLGSEKLQDLSRSQYLSYRSEYMNEQEMVRNIISVVEEKCEEGRFPQAFKQEVENQSSSFRKLILYLKDFIEFNDIFLPEKIVYDQLIQLNYLQRFQHQMSNHLPTRNGSPKGQNKQGQYLPVSLNSDLTKYMHENPQENHLNSPFKRLKSSQLNNSQVNKPNPVNHEANLKFPQSDAIIFNQPNRTYYSNNLNTFPWATKQQLSETPLYQLNTINTNSLTPLSSQPQNYSFPAHHYPTQPINYAQSPHQIPFKQSANDYRGQSINNYQGQLTHPSLTKNNPYQNPPNFGNPSPFKYLNSTNLTTNGIPPTIHAQARNYHPIPSTSLGPVTTSPIFPLSSLKQQIQTSNIQPSGQTAILKRDPLAFQDFKTINKPIQQNSPSQSYNPNPQIYGYSNIYSNNISQTISSKQTFAPLNSINESHQISNPSHYSQPHSSQTFSTFSFGSILEPNSLLSNAYVGTGYSNTLTKYEPSNNISKSVGLEGKYVEEFRSLLSPSLQHNIKIENNNANSIEPKDANTVVGEGIIDTNVKSQGTFHYIKEKSYHESGDEGLLKQKLKVQGDKALTELNSIVERTSNDVSESILKQI